jgi:hypothetical protein
MLEKVPINFEQDGKTYRGDFTLVSGSGSTYVWYLMIDNYYCGRLRYHDWWVFDPTPKTESFVELTDYFGWYITAWYQ